MYKSKISWVRKAAAAVLIMAMGALWLTPVAPATGRVVKALWDFLHFPAALLLFYAARYYLRASAHRSLQAALIALVLISLGEVLQSLTGRSARFIDVLIGLAGILFGWVVSGDRQLRGWPAVGLLAAVALWPALAAWDSYRVQRDFPILGGWRDRLELTRWTFRGVEPRIATSPSAEKGTLQLTVISDSSYPGMYSTEFPGNWSAFSNLVLKVKSQRPAVLWFRADDIRHATYQDRVQAYVQLTGGVQHIRFALSALRKTPDGRPFEWSHIYGFGLFLEQNITNSVEIQNIALE